MPSERSIAPSPLESADSLQLGDDPLDGRIALKGHPAEQPTAVMLVHQRAGLEGLIVLKNYSV